MTVADLINELIVLPWNAEVVAGEWVSPTQLGIPKVQMSVDYISADTPRVHVFAPAYHQLSEKERSSGKYGDFDE